MKKILAMVLAMMLVLSMSAAFAAVNGYNGDTDVTEQPVGDKYVDVTHVGVPKGYTATTNTYRAPATFKYTVTGTGMDNTQATIQPAIDDFTIEFSAAEIEAGVTRKVAKVELPDYKHVGVYYYTITESTTQDYQGVVYDATPVAYLKVTVIEQDTKFVRVVALSLVKNGTDKIDDAEDATDVAFENSYEAGSLSVDKNIDGLMGEKERKFKIKVTFEADYDVTNTIYYFYGEDKTIAPADWTDGKASVELELNHNDTAVTFNNVPVGVKYTVEETDTAITSVDGKAAEYTVKYDNAAGTIAKNTTAAAVVTNTKDGSIDTGISLDNAPYMVLMALVVIAGAALIVKRAAANR